RRDLSAAPLLQLLGLDGHVRGAVGPIGHPDPPGPATDLAVLDIDLVASAAGVQPDLIDLPAVGTPDGGLGVHHALAVLRVVLAHRAATPLYCAPFLHRPGGPSVRRAAPDFS